MTFKQKWENYWYHYKWQTIGAFITLFIVVTVLANYVSKTEPDLNMVYLSTKNISEESIDKIEKDLVSKEVAEDVNDDGKTVVHLEPIVSSFEVDGNTDQGTTQKLQTTMYGGQHTLMLVHQYALEDFDGHFENLSNKAEEGDKTFISPSEGFICAISVEGNEYLESMGINTENLYIAVRRRTQADTKKQKDKEHFDLAYRTLDYMLQR